MFAIIRWILITIFNLLPNSPFTMMLDMMEVDSSYLQYLNWFLPFDYIGKIMLAWIDCLIAYFVFLLIKWLMMKIIIGKLSTLGKFTDIFGGSGGA